MSESIGKLMDKIGSDKALAQYHHAELDGGADSLVLKSALGVFSRFKLQRLLYR